MHHPYTHRRRGYHRWYRLGSIWHCTVGSFAACSLQVPQGKNLTAGHPPPASRFCEIFSRQTEPSLPCHIGSLPSRATALHRGSSDCARPFSDTADLVSGQRGTFASRKVEAFGINVLRKQQSTAVVQASLKCKLR